jgi:hypothetical protein
MPAQEAPVSGDRDQQDADPEPDLHPAGEPGRVDQPDQVVRDEPALVPGFPAAVPQEILQQRERAGEPDELDQRPVRHGRQVRPDDPGPAPGQEDAAHHEADEEQMNDNHEVSGNVVPHLGSTGRRVLIPG